MGTLHRYLLKEVLAALLLTLAVFTFILLLGNVLKEVLALLVNQQIGLGAAAKAIGLLVPFVMVYALPMGLLTAALLVFGRFSADGELTAARASGISLIHLVMPILLLSTMLAGVCATINLYFAPYCRVAYKRLLFELGTEQTGLFLPERTFIRQFDNYIVYLGKVDGTNLQDILAYELDDERVVSYMRAAAGRLSVDSSNQVVEVRLFDAWRIGLGEEGAGSVPLYIGETQLLYTNRTPDRVFRDISVSDMTFAQLREQLARLEQQLQEALAPPQHNREALLERMRELAKLRSEATLPIRVQLHRQLSFSFACIGFALVGIPLGIHGHRRETTFGIAVALVLVLVYYSFFVLGESLDTRPEYAPHLILWLPNFIFQTIGAALLWRANRGI